MESKTEILNLGDDGIIPNSKYPVVIYHGVFDENGKITADFLEERFAQNGWSNAFRWRVYDYHHYHTNTHEVLGVYKGTAELQLGGPQGEKINVEPGDVIILPAGTGHISLGDSKDFAVVGAYPNGQEPDLIRLEDPRPEHVQQTVDSIPVPESDPVYGKAAESLLASWKESAER
ncbi:cupin domain-containing protein [Pedobacter sp. GR22-6]|uniref:cupin domain-containing protein n=1 Tax=Pedobacter sp. GR22-6 TaxID=3127957 RepID=UPI00307DC0A8